jgi:hypothetical protein
LNSYQLEQKLNAVLRDLAIIKAKVSQMPQVTVQVSSRYAPTLIALEKLGGRGYALQVSQVTGRHRAFESKLLNDLVVLGLAVKSRVGRLRVFSLKKVGVFS